MNPTKLLEIIFDENDSCVEGGPTVRESASITKSFPNQSIIPFIQKLAYNAFNGAKVASFLVQMAKQGKIMSFRFGREYSPVLYLTVSPYAKGLCDPPDKNILEIRIQKIIGALKKLKADEVEREGAVEYHDDTGLVQEGGIVRAWWD